MPHDPQRVRPTVERGVRASAAERSSRTDRAAHAAAALFATLADVLALHLTTVRLQRRLGESDAERHFERLLARNTEELSAMVDPLAERSRALGADSLRALGVDALHVVGALDARESSADAAPPQPAASHETRALLALLRRGERGLTRRLRELARFGDTGGDHASAQVLERWLDESHVRAHVLADSPLE